MVGVEKNNNKIYGKKQQRISENIIIIIENIKTSQNGKRSNLLEMLQLNGHLLR